MSTLLAVRTTIVLTAIGVDYTLKMWKKWICIIVGIIYHDNLAIIYTNNFVLNGSILRKNIHWHFLLQNSYNQLAACFNAIILTESYCLGNYYCWMYLLIWCKENSLGSTNFVFWPFFWNWTRRLQFCSLTLYWSFEWI